MERYRNNVPFFFDWLKTTATENTKRRQPVYGRKEISLFSLIFLLVCETYVLRTFSMVPTNEKIVGERRQLHRHFEIISTPTIAQCPKLRLCIFLDSSNMRHNQLYHDVSNTPPALFTHGIAADSIIVP